MLTYAFNVSALKNQTFKLGTAKLRETLSCPPCSRKGENLGPGGYAGMLNHGGITAIVGSEGLAGIGDSVVALSAHSELLQS